MSKLSKELQESLAKTQTPEFKKKIQEVNIRAESTNMVRPADPVGRVKFDICDALTKMKVENKLSNEEFASRLGITQAQGSLITHRKINKISLDFLVSAATKSGTQSQSIRSAVERLSLSFA